MMPTVTIYAAPVCRYCAAAERLLKEKGVTGIRKIDIDLDPRGRDRLEEKTGRRTVPQIYIGDYHVGGYDDLAALEKAGELDRLLSGESTLPY